MRDSCVIVFTAIAQSFSEAENRRVIEGYFPYIQKLIIAIAASQPPASDPLLASTISLVGDLITVFGVQMTAFVDSEPITNIMARLRRSRHNKAKTAVNWVSREIARVRRQAGA